MHSSCSILEKHFVQYISDISHPVEDSCLLLTGQMVVRTLKAEFKSDLDEKTWRFSSVGLTDVTLLMWIPS